ncbi:MAG: helix-turn-helix transcriptional regulator [Lachnospiraceae bacterium]|nr:helix-turn-helix transcriptional regulator [Lachnospiraceae bacterium]
MEYLTMADIAEAAGYSPNYLSRKFREAAGIGVHEYLVFIRLQHAALELITTDNSITEIALRCGFSDSNYFKDAFKKRYGVTPRAYRK